MKKQILLILSAIIPINFFAMEKLPQLSSVYLLISSDNYEFVVQPKFLENSEPLKAIFTGKFKESKQNKLSVLLPGAALETLLNLMHVDQINDEKKLKDDECFTSLTRVLHADSKRGDYILDLLAKANEWMVCPMVTNAITTEAAELIFHDEQARAECMQKMSVQDQLYLLNKFSFASRYARNYIPALTVLHGMKNKKEITQDHELDKERSLLVWCFLVAALGNVREWATQSGASTVAEFINSSVLQELDPHFKDNLYKKLEEPETVDSGRVMAIDRVDDAHVVYGGERTAGILDLQSNTVKDLPYGYENITPIDATFLDHQLNPVKPDIIALASISQNKYIVKPRGNHFLDLIDESGRLLKRKDFSDRVGRLLVLDAHRVAVCIDDPADICICVLNLENLSTIQLLAGHGKQISCLLKVGNSKLVSGSMDCTARISDLNSPTNATNCLTFKHPIHSLLFLNNRFLVLFGTKASIWDMVFEHDQTDQIGKLYRLTSCDGVNNTYGGIGTVALITDSRMLSLKKLLDAIGGIPNLQLVIPFNQDHLMAVYNKTESMFSPLPAAIRVWNIHSGIVVSEQHIEKDSIASIICADNKIIYGTTTGLMLKHVPQAYPSLTALLERLTLQKP
jgi:WD40 repeat protein